MKNYLLGGMYTYYYHDGRYADWGDYALKAAQMALSEINALPVLSCPMVMPDELVYDYHCWPDKAGELAQRLFEKNILALTGADCSGPAALITQKANEYKIPVISYGVNASEFSSPEQYPYFIRVVTPSEIFDGYLVALASYLGIKKLLFLHTNDSWGKGAYPVVTDFAKRYGVEIQAVEYPRNMASDALAKLIKPFIHADCHSYLVIGPTPDTVIAFNALAMLKAKTEQTRIFAAEMISADESEHVVNNCCGYIAPMVSLPESHLLKTFLRNFEKFTGDKIDVHSKAFSFAALSYDHIYALAHAIKKLEESRQAINGENLMKSLRTVDFQGVSGRVAFTEHTNDRAFMNVVFYNNQGIKNGQVNFVPVGGINPETHEIVFDSDKVRWN